MDLAKPLTEQAVDLLLALSPAERAIVERRLNEQGLGAELKALAQTQITFKRHIVAKLESIPEDMPLFLVQAIDVLGPETVRSWCYSAKRVAVSEAKIASAEATAAAMEDWQINNTKHIPG